MIQDKRLEQIHDYVNASDCFPGVEIKGGVNYFLWNKEYDGDCEIFTYENNQLISKMKRPLLLEGSNVFVRYNESINILQKIRSFSEDGFSRLVSSNDPFGFDVREKGSYKRIKPNYKLKPFSDSVRFYYNNWSNEGIGYISKKDVRKNSEWVNEIKVLIPKAVGTGNPKDDEFKPFIVESGSCCSETYLVIGPCPSYKYAENMCSYIRTKFFHFLVTLVKNTQGAYKPVYQFVPLQNFGENWSDEKLYKKYNLNEDEIDFIENMIRPME
jgi:site-specific DNA-methyltransferase (adenine-specific)